MRTQSGILKMNKTERKEIEEMLLHVEEDISYQGGGTFNKRDDGNSFDDKAAKRARKAVENIRWILEAYLD